MFESTELLKTIKCHQNNMYDEICGHQVHARCSRFDKRLQYIDFSASRQHKNMFFVCKHTKLRSTHPLVIYMNLYM